MAELHFFDEIHTATKRDYLARVLTGKKTEHSLLARKFGYEYWDGSRDTGYGGYRYDGRWKAFAQSLASHYQLKSGQRVLDLGCGKGYMVYDLQQAVPGLVVEGIDISDYALEHCKAEVAHCLKRGDAAELTKIEDKSYDLVLAINTLHNLELPALWKALANLERISRKNKYIVVDSYRNVPEMLNLMHWQLTCECFFSYKEWEFLFDQTGYQGDWDYVFFS